MQITSKDYVISVGNDSLKKLNAFLRARKYSSYYILGDENTVKHCLPLLISQCKELIKAEIFEVESGEVSKGLDVCSQLWQALIEYKADKQALIINLGGGVISDLGGFLATIYKRGVHFVNIPTTLLAMADASVGGKNGINLNGIKNVLGTITQPQAVFIYPEFLATLPERQINSGLAEIYKIALISDKAFWNKLSSGKMKGIEEVIVKSVQLKNRIVQRDPDEKNIRKVLNFGHTIGHAIESASQESKEPLLHGEAVVIGIICESYIAYRKKLLTRDNVTEITEIMKFTFPLRKISEKEYQNAGEFILNDKKNKSGKLMFVLPNGIGKCRLDVSVNVSLVSDALNFYNSIVDDYS